MAIREHDTSARILDAATEAFAEKGYRGTSTRDICKRAGVNQALINYYWGSKERLFADVCTACNQWVLSLAQAAIEPGHGLEETISTFVRRMLEHLADDPRGVRVAMWASLQAADFDYAVVHQAFAPALQLGAGYLAAQHRAGVIPQADFELLLITFYGQFAQPFVQDAVHRSVFGRDMTDPEHRARVERHLVQSALRLLGLERTSR